MSKVRRRKAYPAVLSSGSSGSFAPDPTSQSHIDIPPAVVEFYCVVHA